jgi:hypothetical protein
MTVVARSLGACVRAYQLTLSALIGRDCRFLPTCSDYAREALQTHGVAAGAWLALKRFLRCHPFAKAGLDPVPPAASHATCCKKTTRT